MKSPHLRIYLTGRICTELGTGLIDESRFPSRQARLLFAYLVCERARPVHREELAELLWPGETPSAWDTSLKALISKLRNFIGEVAPDSSLEISSQFGCYRLHLPAQTWLDLEAARNAIDEAEGALRVSDWKKAWGPTNVCLTIAKRSFMPGETSSWAETKRRELKELRMRSLDCYSEIGLQTGRPELAVQVADQSIALEPYREVGYQRLMRAQASLGNRAEAIRTYHRCRELLSEELGVDPSPETEELFRELLQ